MFTYPLSFLSFEVITRDADGNPTSIEFYGDVAKTELRFSHTITWYEMLDGTFAVDVLDIVIA